MGTLDDWLSYMYPSNASAPPPERGPGESMGGIGLDLVSGAIGGLGSLAKRVFQASDAMQKGYGYDPAPAVNAAMLTMGGGAFGAPMRAGEAALGAGPIRGYHGSPYDFDKFDMSKIGSGEGAQAYGHGLYFAENPATAADYRSKLSVGDLNNPNDIASAYSRTMSDRKAAIDALRDNAAKWKPGDATSPDVLRKAADLLESGANPKNPGHMYEVGINADPEHFLDWDKPLSEQSEHVRNALAPYGQAETAPGEQIVRGLEYGRIGTNSGEWNKERASTALRSAGIPGIKYLDQGSRAGGEGTRNYVVFDDSIIDILRKYGLVGTLGSGITAYDAKRNANK